MKENIKLAKKLVKVAKSLVSADYEYIYDPDHKNHPGGGYIKTEKGWAKGDNGEEKDTKRDLVLKISSIAERIAASAPQAHVGVRQDGNGIDITFFFNGTDQFERNDVVRNVLAMIKTIPEFSDARLFGPYNDIITMLEGINFAKDCRFILRQRIGCIKRILEANGVKLRK